MLASYARTGIPTRCVGYVQSKPSSITLGFQSGRLVSNIYIRRTAPHHGIAKACFCDTASKPHRLIASGTKSYRKLPLTRRCVVQKTSQRRSLHVLSTSSSASDFNSVPSASTSSSPKQPFIETGWFRIAFAAAYVAHLGSNVAAAKGIFGPTVTALSAKYPTLLTPAGWTFSIWGVIFALQGFGLISWLLSSKRNQLTKIDPAAMLAAPLWIVGWGCQTAWLILFAQEAIVLCQVALIGATIAFQMALFRLRRLAPRQLSDAPPAPPDESITAEGSSLGTRGPSGRVTWGWIIPTSINAAWLTVAASIGVCQLAGAFQLTVTPVAAVLAAVALVALNGVVERPLPGGKSPHPNPAYSLTLAWAFQGLHAAATEPLIMQGMRFLQGLLLAGVAVTLVRTVANKLNRTTN